MDKIGAFHFEVIAVPLLLRGQRSEFYFYFIRKTGGSRYTKQHERACPTERGMCFREFAHLFHIYLPCNFVITHQTAGPAGDVPASPRRSFNDIVPATFKRATVCGFVPVRLMTNEPL